MFFAADPEEVERHRAHHRAQAHEINSLFNTLSEHNLRVLGQILDGIVMSDDPVKVSAYFGGRVTAVMEHRFGECSACGVNHNKELASLTGEGEPQPAAKSTVATPPWVEARRASEGNEVTFTPLLSTDQMSDGEKELMAKYGLDDVRDEDTFQLLRFMCLNCGSYYQSIQDRMIDPPGIEGCDGCIQKAKHG